MTKEINYFSYNTKNGCIYANDKHIVRWRFVRNSYSFFITVGRGVQYLNETDLEKLAKTAKWMTDKQGSNFGEPIEFLIRNYYKGEKVS